MRKRLLWKKGAPFFLLFFILVMWEVLVSRLHIESWLLPAPSVIFETGIAEYERIVEHVTSTVQLALVGLIIGSLIGIVLATCLHLFPLLKEAVYPLLILSQNIPIIVLAPLLIIWFGFGIESKLVVISLVCFFPVSVSMLDGLRQIPSEFSDYFEMMGANKMQVFWKLELPHVLPNLFSGLKISATYSVMGAVISEWLGAQKGLGVYMTLASSAYRTDRVFVAIFLIMIVSILFFIIITVLEKSLISWKRKEESSKNA